MAKRLEGYDHKYNISLSVYVTFGFITVIFNSCAKFHAKISCIAEILTKVAVGLLFYSHPVHDL